MDPTLEPIKIETVPVGRGSLHFFRFGRGEKTLVILPGLSVQSVMGAAEAIAAAYRSLADSFTIIVFDRRSDLPPVYSVRDMARDTAAAFRALGLARHLPAHLPDTRQLSRATPARSSA